MAEQENEKAWNIVATFERDRLTSGALLEAAGMFAQVVENTSETRARVRQEFSTTYVEVEESDFEIAARVEASAEQKESSARYQRQAAERKAKIAADLGVTVAEYDRAQQNQWK